MELALRPLTREACQSVSCVCGLFLNESGRSACAFARASIGCSVPGEIYLFHRRGNRDVSDSLISRAPSLRRAL